MDTSSFCRFIPLQIGDIVQCDNFNNPFKLNDIIVLHSVKNDTHTVYLDLIDMELEFKVKLCYDDHKWSILKYSGGVTNETV